MEEIIEAIQRLEGKIDGLSRAVNKMAAQSSIKTVAPAVATRDTDVPPDIDGPKGDPEIRFEPRDWKGPPCRGKRMSECPADFLDAFAKFKDWSAAKDDGAGTSGEVDAKGYPKSGKWARFDAALARGWADRARAKLATQDQLPF